MRFLIPFLLFLAIPRALATDLPRYNEVFQAADHNAYFIKRTPKPDEIFASGTQTRISDQLLFHHARSLEIDIHKNQIKRGEWKVYHTARTKNSFCADFRDCLRQLKLFHLANPKHEVITIVTELKQLIEFNFDHRHTPEDLDRLVEEELGAYLYRPRDLMAQCTQSPTLRDCMAVQGSVWPRVDELRGKFIFTLLGNWRYWFIGHGSHDWATYATVFKGSSKSIRDRVFFPMETDFLTYTENAHGLLGSIPNLETARLNSIFLQVEKLNDPAHLADVSVLLAKGLMVRGGDSYDLDTQKKRLDAGFHFLQTDYPWNIYADAGPDYPFRRKDNFEPILEPGERYFLHKNSEKIIEQKGEKFWVSTLVSSARTSPNPLYPETSAPNGVGCLYAKSEKKSYEFCRKVDLASQRVTLTAGEKQFVETKKNRLTDWLRLAQVDAQYKGQTCLSFQYASVTQKSATQPIWTELTKQCFDDRITEAGLKAYDGDVVFLVN